MCSVRASAKSGPALTCVGVTSTVLCMGWPVTSSPPTMRSSPDWSTVAVCAARAAGRFVIVTLAAAATALPLLLLLPPPQPTPSNEVVARTTDHVK